MKKRKTKITINGLIIGNFIMILMIFILDNKLNLKIYPFALLIVSVNFYQLRKIFLEKLISKKGSIKKENYILKKRQLDVVCDSDKQKYNIDYVNELLDINIEKIKNLNRKISKVSKTFVELLISASILSFILIILLNLKTFSFV